MPDCGYVIGRSCLYLNEGLGLNENPFFWQKFSWRIRGRPRVRSSGLGVANHMKVTVCGGAAV